jgi:hypothetical protein
MKEIHDSSIHRVFLYPWLSPRQAALWGGTAGVVGGIERGVGGVREENLGWRKYTILPFIVCFSIRGYLLADGQGVGVG